MTHQYGKSGGMTELETIRIRSKLQRFQLSNRAIQWFLDEFDANLETYDSANQIVDAWEPIDSGGFILQALSCGLIAELLRGSLARLGGL